MRKYMDSNLAFLDQLQFTKQNPSTPNKQGRSKAIKGQTPLPVPWLDLNNYWDLSRQADLIYK